jgi:glycine cleavage system H protein
LINEDPQEAAWIFKMKLNNPSEMDALLDENAYKAHIA